MSGDQVDMDATPRSRLRLSRISRPIFAVLHLGLTALLYGVFLIALMLVLGPCPPSSEPPPTWQMVALGSITAVLLAGRLWLEMKRLHDVGWSGWWALLVLALTIAAGCLPLAAGALKAVPAVTVMAWFLLLALMPGTTGDNRFGRRPASGFRLEVP